MYRPEKLLCRTLTYILLFLNIRNKEKKKDCFVQYLKPFSPSFEKAKNEQNMIGFRVIYFLSKPQI